MEYLAHGIYETLTDEFLRDTLALHPELRTVFGKIDPEELIATKRHKIRKNEPKNGS